MIAMVTNTFESHNISQGRLSKVFITTITNVEKGIIFQLFQPAYYAQVIS